MYASAVAWNFKPGMHELVSRVSQDVLVPTVKTQLGFCRYLLVRTGTDSWLMITQFDTKDNQDAAMAVLNPLIRRHQGRIIEGMQRYAGEVEVEEAAMT